MEKAKARNGSITVTMTAREEEVLREELARLAVKGTETMMLSHLRLLLAGDEG